MQQASLLESALKHDRLIVLSGMLGVTVLAWAYTLSVAARMSGVTMQTSMVLPDMRPWSTIDFLLTFAMWLVMMAAMMVPSAAPMLLLFATANRTRERQRAPYFPTAIFLLGYLVVWGGFSVLATFAQWVLHSAALLTAMMAISSPIVGGALLIIAGIYQWIPLKHACLTQCRSPLGFLMSEWRDGRRGTLVMGLRHGLFCVGCCWFLMALLFVGGIMNLLWVAGIAVYVLAEKVAPAGHWVGRASGIVLCGWGLWVLTSALG